MRSRFFLAAAAAESACFVRSSLHLTASFVLMLARRLEAASSFANTLRLSQPACLLISYNKGYRSLVSDASLHVYLYTCNTVYTHGSGFDSTSGLSKTCTSRCVFVCVFGPATCVFRFRLIYVCVCVLNRVQAEKIVRTEYNRACWKGS